MNGRLVVCIVTLVVSPILSGCTTTTLRSVQRAPELQTDRIHKVLVVCATSTPGLRHLVESTYRAQWKKRGVVVEASEETLPAGTTLDKAGIAPFAKTNGFDAVMVTRLLKRDQLNAQTPEQSNLSQDVQAIVASPEYGMSYEVAVVSSSLYDTATEKRLWNAISESVVAGDASTRVTAYVKLMLQKLYSDR